MKKFVIKISLICVIIAILLLTLFVLLSRDEDIPSYRFLGGRNPTACEKGKAQHVDKLYTYSF